MISLADLCPCLSNLDIHSRQITGRLLIRFAEGCQIRSLEDLNLSGCIYITHSGALAIVENLVVLEILHLSECVQLTDLSIIYVVHRCCRLKTIFVCNITEVCQNKIEESYPGLYITA